MGIFAKLWMFLTVIVIALWLATQRFAEMMNYHPLLGHPFMMNGHAYYWPWKYFGWWLEFHGQAPLAFRVTNLYVFVGVVIGMVMLYFLHPKKKLDSHGSASWGEQKDLLDMGLISAGGVVIGLHDNALVKAATSFMRFVESAKKEKVSFAEMAYDRRMQKKIAKWETILEKLQNKAADISDDTLQKRKVQKAIQIYQSLLNNPQPYDPKKEDRWTVYPFVCFYETMLKLYKKVPHFYLRDNSNKHLAVIAPTRSGKGVGLIIPTLLGGWKESVIVNDIKSENWGVTAGCRKRMGHMVIKFEPTAEDGSSARWNPLDEIRIGTPSEVPAAQNLAYILADYEGKGKLDHWGSNAATVIMVVILHLKYAHFADPVHYPEEPTLFSVASFLKANIVPEMDKNGNPVWEYVDEDGDVSDTPKEGYRKQQKMMAAGFKDTLENLQCFEHVPDDGIEIREWNKKKEMYGVRKFLPEDMAGIYKGASSLEDMPNTHPIIYQNFVEILSKPDNECGSIISTANTALKEYLDPVLSRNTSTSDFCVDDIMNYKKPVSLYLVTPPSDLLRLAPIFRLFFEMMVKHHARKIGTYENGRAKAVYKHKCLFLMDEFSSLGNLQSFAATLSYIAGYGMKVFLINQGLPQINGIYGKDNQILMNCHLQIFYAPNDNDTGKYAESLLGNKTIMVESESDSGWFTKRQYTRSAQARALMTADELKRLGDREIVVASGSPPLLTDKVKYYESEFFLDRLADAPIASDVIRHEPYPERDALLSQKRQKKEKPLHIAWQERQEVEPFRPVWNEGRGSR